MASSTNGSAPGGSSQSDNKVPESLVNNVLKHSSPLPSTTPTVKGFYLQLVTAVIQSFYFKPSLLTYKNNQ